MAIKIMVPGSAIHNLAEGDLVLNFPPRCSRCGATPANQFETHRLKFRAGYNTTHLYGKKYKVSKNYNLKIRICESCYHANYLSHPETMDRDATALGRSARIHSVLWLIGGMTAGLGLLLLTPLVPQVSFLGTLKSYWHLVTAGGVFVLLVAWLIQKNMQRKVFANLTEAKYDFDHLQRAEARTPILENADSNNGIALEIGLDNEEWGRECAEHAGWHSEKKEETNHPSEKDSL